MSGKDPAVGVGGVGRAFNDRSSNRPSTSKSNISCPQKKETLPAKSSSPNKFKRKTSSSQFDNVPKFTRTESKTKFVFSSSESDSSALLDEDMERNTSLVDDLNVNYKNDNKKEKKYLIRHLIMHLYEAFITMKHL
ncbi:unnamed protein product [Brachionus calyciflorus]|uniref:Uncharacterized protein n=1 Tax=Brachionus calyciflorus TaxID=104777 RepID=A0A814IDA0_9BILA|nr:unnamed protein product [Brachionus calyciflorus]